ncbi:MAG: hypothetical protein CMA77_02350 [Euryarchaeota archaeon]|nr:hypothetical protein [Euryarchaeota archaeon]
MNEANVETEGASLPDGIDVDEAAAYFGVVESADIIVRLNQTDRLNGMGEFFSLTIDLVLQGEFDFEEAANRLGCEGGEIYYLLTGPFGLITISDPLRYYLGQENSEGESGPPPGLPEHEMNAIEPLTDVFSLLRLFGLGHLIGGLPLLSHYISMYERLVSSPGANKESLLILSQELHEATEQAKSGSVTPIACLGAPTQSVVPQAIPPQSNPAPAAPAAPTSPEPVEPTPPPPEPVISAPPAPSPTSPQPVEPTPPAPQPEPEPVVIEVDSSEDEAIVMEDASDVFASQFAAAESIDTTTIEAPQSSQQFNSIDINMDGQLSPNEVSQAANITMNQANEMIEFADKNEDGQVSFEEFTEKPQGVVPKRAPIRDDINSQSIDTGWPDQNQNKPEQSALDAVSSLVSGVSDNQNPSTVHNLIQSGKNCQRCGIGVEHQWIYCPVCNSPQ